MPTPAVAMLMGAGAGSPVALDFTSNPGLLTTSDGEATQNTHIYNATTDKIDSHQNRAAGNNPRGYVALPSTVVADDFTITMTLAGTTSGSSSGFGFLGIWLTDAAPSNGNNLLSATMTAIGVGLYRDSGDTGVGDNLLKFIPVVYYEGGGSSIPPGYQSGDTDAFFLPTAGVQYEVRIEVADTTCTMFVNDIEEASLSILGFTGIEWSHVVIGSPSDNQGTSTGSSATPWVRSFLSAYEVSAT